MTVKQIYKLPAIASAIMPLKASSPGRFLALLASFALPIIGLVAALHAIGVLPEKQPGPLPSWVGSAVWILLFLLFAAAFWMVRRVPELRRSIILFCGFCLAYPFYTFGFRSLTLGLIGNLATFTAAVILIAKLSGASRMAAALVAPVLPWLVYATWTILIEIVEADYADLSP